MSKDDVIHEPFFEFVLNFCMRPMRHSTRKAYFCEGVQNYWVYQGYGVHSGGSVLSHTRGTAPVPLWDITHIKQIMFSMHGWCSSREAPRQGHGQVHCDVDNLVKTIIFIDGTQWICSGWECIQDRQEGQIRDCSPLVCLKLPMLSQTKVFWEMCLPFQSEHRLNLILNKKEFFLVRTTVGVTAGEAGVSAAARLALSIEICVAGANVIGLRWFWASKRPQRESASHVSAEDAEQTWSDCGFGFLP